MNLARNDRCFQSLITLEYQNMEHVNELGHECIVFMFFFQYVDVFEIQRLKISTACLIVRCSLFAEI